VIASVGLAVSALATQTRLRLERIDPTDFAADGTVRIYASVVELEGTVIDDKGAPQFALHLDGKSGIKPDKVARFQSSGDPLDLVLVVESSALYGAQKVVEPPPPLPPPPKVKGKKGGKPDKKSLQKSKQPVAPPPPAPKVVVSGDEPLDKVKDGARQLLEALNPKSRVLVIDYGGDVTPHPPFRPAPAAGGAVDDLSPDGESGDLRLADAVRAALIELQKPRPGGDDAKPARRLIIVISDGLNSQMDRKTFRAIGDAAAKAHVPIHTIAFSPSDERGPMLNLGEISKRSNGTFRWARGADDLRTQIETLTDELNKQYVLTFKLDVSELDGHSFTLDCDELRSNKLSYDASGGMFGENVKTTRGLAWYWWLSLAVGVGLLALVLVRLFKRPKKRFATTRQPGSPSQPMQKVAAPVQAPQQQPVAAPVQAAAARGVLIVVSGALAGQRLSLSAQPFTIGKGPSTLQITDDPTVSTRHAQLSADRGGFIVTDLGSTNGSFVNNTRVTQPTRVQDGDLLRFGNTTIKFRVE